jgi:hypothetical protein
MKQRIEKIGKDALTQLGIPDISIADSDPGISDSSSGSIRFSQQGRSPLEIKLDLKASDGDLEAYMVGELLAWVAE